MITFPLSCRRPQHDVRRSSFWSKLKPRFPLLYVASLIIILGPAQSMANERVHSVMRRVLTYMRSSQTPATVENLTLLHCSVRRLGNALTESFVDELYDTIALERLEVESAEIATLAAEAPAAEVAEDLDQGPEDDADSVGTEDDAPAICDEDNEESE
jgi:hypothetical protein